MRRKLIYLVQLFFLIIFVMFLSSCKENIVNPSSGTYIGPPRYHWKIDTLTSTTSDMLILDTNDYFTVSNYIHFGEIHHFKNGIRTDYNTNYYTTSIDGTDENNIYIGGCGTISSNYYNYPTLTKFSNGSFTNINTGCDTADGNLVTSVKIINNNVWGVTSRGEAFRYDGINTAYFRVDTNYQAYLIANDIFKNVYMVMWQPVYDSLGVPKDAKIKILLYKNNGWTIIHEAVNTANYDEDFYRGFDNKIFCKKMKNFDNLGTFDFSLGNFTLVFNENSYGINGKFGGNSINNFIIVCPSNEDYKKIYFWNGMFLSDETINITNRILLNLCHTIKITEKNNKFFILFWDYGLTDHSYLLKTIF
jgi:hypothetical protein